jgi:hypothetical protein
VQKGCRGGIGFVGAGAGEVSWVGRVQTEGGAGLGCLRVVREGCLPHLSLQPISLCRGLVGGEQAFGCDF